MNDKSLFDLSAVLFTASLSQLAVFLLYLASDRKGSKRLNAGLAFILIFITIPYLSVFFLIRGPVLFLIPLAHTGSVIGFLSGPALFFYLREFLTGRRPDFRTDRTHFLLLGIILTSFVILAIIESGNYSAGFADLRFLLLFIPYEALYLSLSISLIVKNRIYSGTIRRSVRWAVFLLAGNITVQFTCGFIFLIWVIIPRFNHGFWSSRLYFLMKPYSLIGYFMVFIIFINIMIYFCFHGIQMTGHLKKYRHSRLGTDEKIVLRRRIETWMKTDKPFLDPLLSLESMASSLRMSCKDLSQILNECFSANFSDFVNSYRIREAMRIMDQHDPDRTILDISLDSGFNAKSTFNMVFKKQIGMSPRDYIRNKRKDHKKDNTVDNNAADPHHAFGVSV